MSEKTRVCVVTGVGAGNGASYCPKPVCRSST